MRCTLPWGICSQQRSVRSNCSALCREPFLTSPESRRVRRDTMSSRQALEFLSLSFQPAPTNASCRDRLDHLARTATARSVAVEAMCHAAVQKISWQILSSAPLDTVRAHHNDPDLARCAANNSLSSTQFPENHSAPNALSY